MPIQTFNRDLTRRLGWTAFETGMWFCFGQDGEPRLVVDIGRKYIVFVTYWAGYEAFDISYLTRGDIEDRNYFRVHMQDESY